MNYEQIFTYESWGHMLAAAEIPALHPSPVCDRKDEWWAGSESLPAFLATARAGNWSSGQDRSMVDAIANAVGSHVQIPTYQATDDPAFAETFDVGALTQGDPDHWIAPVYTDATMAGARVITIAANVSVNAGVSHDAIIRRGALAVAIVEALELASYPVELIGVEVGVREEDRAEFRFPIKPAGQPLDRDRALIALAHPSTQRRACFALYENCPDQRIYNAMGKPGTTGGRAAPSTLTADIKIPELTSHTVRMFESDRAAIQWALAELARIGAVLEPAA